MNEEGDVQRRGLESESIRPGQSELKPLLRNMLLERSQHAFAPCAPSRGPMRQDGAARRQRGMLWRLWVRQRGMLWTIASSRNGLIAAAAAGAAAGPPLPSPAVVCSDAGNASFGHRFSSVGAKRVWRTRLRCGFCS